MLNIIIKFFTSNEIDNENLDNFEIISKRPNDLIINGLSSFLSDPENLEVKIVNTDVVLFKGLDKNKNYSESGIINRKSGELVHEITRDINSETTEKDITFYDCKETNKKRLKINEKTFRDRVSGFVVVQYM